jgi:predicted small lipoprotein YifL
MHRILLILLLVAAGSLLAGCGAKGPLVMPADAPPPMDQPAPASSIPAHAASTPAIPHTH